MIWRNMMEANVKRKLNWQFIVVRSMEVAATAVLVPAALILGLDMLLPYLLQASSAEHMLVVVAAVYLLFTILRDYIELLAERRSRQT